MGEWRYGGMKRRKRNCTNEDIDKERYGGKRERRGRYGKKEEEMKE